MKIVTALAVAALIGAPAARAQTYHDPRYDDGRGGAPVAPAGRVGARTNTNVNANARVPLAGGYAGSARGQAAGGRAYRDDRDGYGRDGYGRDGYGRDGGAFVGGLAAGAALGGGYYGYGAPDYGYDQGYYGAPGYAYDQGAYYGDAYAPAYADQGAYYDDDDEAYAPGATDGSTAYGSSYGGEVGAYGAGAQDGYAGYTGGYSPQCGQWAWDPVMGRYVWSC